MIWHAATVVGVNDETATARTIVLDVPNWPGHLAGQHVDVRLTAADGYTAARSYSIASAVAGTRVDLTVERIDDGEVSPYLTRELRAGDVIEISGPIGEWFVWRDEQSEPVQLVAGGSGIVPLMAMIRTRSRSESQAPFRLLYSVREPAVRYYREELTSAALPVAYAYTRIVPPGWPHPPARVSAADLAETAWPAERAPTCYVCGPTPFVEAIAEHLTSLGHRPDAIRTERFGPT